jgi:ABC-2 type transport system permease protein
VAALNSIAEEKEKWTLRTLMLANVRAEQILFSKGLVALVLVTVINVVCLLLLGSGFAQAPGILLIGMLGALPIILISLIFGLAGRDQMTAGIFGLPILIIALAPLFGQYGGTVAQLARFSPTGGMVETISLLQDGALLSADAIVPLATTLVWIVAGFLVYALLFKRLIRDN